MIELERAASLCTCLPGTCDRACITCFSPTWQDKDCVKLLWANFIRPSLQLQNPSHDESRKAIELHSFLDATPTDEGTTMPLSDIVKMKNIYGTPVAGDIKPRPTPKDVEAAIDWMEANGIPLVPWQAYMFRAIMAHDGPVDIMSPRTYGRR